jgi:hypothetical protein
VNNFEADFMSQFCNFRFPQFLGALLLILSQSVLCEVQEFLRECGLKKGQSLPPYLTHSCSSDHSAYEWGHFQLQDPLRKYILVLAIEKKVHFSPRSSV